MKPKNEEKQEDGKIIGSTQSVLQLSDTQGQDLIKWAKAVLEEKVNDVKVNASFY